MSDEKPTPEELGRLVEELAQREEWGGVETLSDAEREARLAKSGIDRERARDIGDRVHAKIEAAAKAKEASATNPEPLAKLASLVERRRARFARIARITAYAVAALVLLAIGVRIGRQTTGDDGVAGGFDGGPNWDRIQKLRDESFDAFAEGRYADYLQKLDEAKALGAHESKDDALRRRQALAALAGEAGVREGGTG